MADGSPSLFDGLIRSILEHPDRDDAIRIQAERRLEEAIEDGLKYRLPAWKTSGSVTPISIIFSLPASNAVYETTEDYEREVYGRAASILRREGFTFRETEQRWYYRR